MNSVPASGALDDPLVGRVIQDRYRICRAIGRGGMGVVYEAQHLLIGRKVAIKTLAPQLSVSPAAVQRFRREAQAAAAVGSSHVVDVIDMGRLEEGWHYLVLEHLDGLDLGYAVAREGRFKLDRALHVLSQLCDALSAVHAAGIVHRDLKPDNIFLLQRDGMSDFVKVLDFGVCKFEETDGARLTLTGDTIGTPQFMAPEQVEGRRDVDHRADIYSLGAILHFMLTGRAPFTAASLPKLFLKICHEPAPSLRSAAPDLPIVIEQIVQRALQKAPENRYASCHALKSALLPLLSHAEQWAPTLCEFPRTLRADANTAETDTAATIEALGLRRSSRITLALLGAGLVVASGWGVERWLRPSRERAESPSFVEAARSALPSAVDRERAVIPAPPPVPSLELGNAMAAQRSGEASNAKRVDEPSEITRVADPSRRTQSSPAPSASPAPAPSQVESDPVVPFEAEELLRNSNSSGNTVRATSPLPIPHLNRDPKRGL